MNAQFAKVALLHIDDVSRNRLSPHEWIAGDHGYSSRHLLMGIALPCRTQIVQMRVANYGVREVDVDQVVSAVMVRREEDLARPKREPPDTRAHSDPHVILKTRPTSSYEYDERR